MKIAIDIGHPAHVHFFKHFIWEMEKKGHECLITVAEKDIACALLDNYGFQYTNHGSYGHSIGKKLINILVMDYKLYHTVKSFRPDVFMGLASVRAAHTAFFLRKPCVLFDDTENGKAEVILYSRFTSYICTPSCYQGDLGAKQIRYDGYHELAYLHPNRFTPDVSVLKKMDLSEHDPFVIMRFVGWGAVHDIGHAGIGLEHKRQAVRTFSEHARVFITSESPLPEDLEPYRIQIPPEEIHHVLSYATLLYGESATMASECAVLGTPAIYLDNVGRGYTDEQEHTYDSVFNFTESPEDCRASIQKGVDILTTTDVRALWKEKKERLLREKIDVTDWMIQFVEQRCGS